MQPSSEVQSSPSPTLRTMYLDKLLWDEKIECEKSSPLHIICIENIYLYDCIIHTIVPKLKAAVHVSKCN